MDVECVVGRCWMVESGDVSRGEAHTRHTGITAGVGGERWESSAKDAAAAAQRASERLHGFLPEYLPN